MKMEPFLFFCLHQTILADTMSTQNNLFNPNHIPVGERIGNIIFSSILLIYGTVGVFIDDLYIPGKRNPGIHFHGEPAWIMYGAFVCASANMLSVVVDHYDERNNETNYKLFARCTQVAGMGAFCISNSIGFIGISQGTR
jgi:hypothetical protein